MRLGLGSRIRASRGYLFIAAATAFFSSMEIALKTVAGRFNSIELNFLRFAVGGLFLLPLAIRSLRRNGKRLSPGDLGFLALSGLACVGLSMTLYQIAIEHCKASIVAILFSCNPVFVIPLAALAFGERIRGYTVVSMLASLGGMACIMAASLSSPGPGSVGVLGIFLVIGSALVFAVYSLMGKARADLGGLATTAFSFILGSAELALLMLASRVGAVAAALRGAGLARFAAIPFFAGLDWSVMPVFAYISLCVTGLGYASYFLAIEKTSASTAALVFYIKPALAPVLALVILGEAIAPATVAGIALIATGSAAALAEARVSARAETRRAASPPSGA
jgi:drug/metabolite transporter (DMT)-like permease